MKKARLFILTITLGMTFIFPDNSISQCPPGNSIQLDGIDDYLHTPFQNYDFSNFTVECWIKVPTYTDNVHYVSLQHNAYIVIGDWYTVPSITTWAAGLSPVSLSSSAFDTTDTWYHIAFVYDGITQYLYINGVVDSAAASTGPVYHDTTYNSGLVIGARFNQGEQYVEGKLDEVRLWNIARSQSEIQNNMNSVLIGNEEGLLAYYQFEDGPGSDTVTDVSGNGNTLALNYMDINEVWVNDSPVDPGYNIKESVSASCGESYTFPDGTTRDSIVSQVIHVSNLLSVYSCDSIITTTVNVNSVNTSVSLENITLTADAEGAVYQWIDCNNENAVIEGETGQSFTTDASGLYAVIITENLCTDTSECYNVVISQMKENDFNKQILVYPNPAVNFINIDLSERCSEILVELTNLKNQTIIRKSLNNLKYLSIDISSLTPGIYFIKICSDENISIKKFIKE